MCGRSYRPRPANGSGDSPRPPFLSEFVNHIGKLSLVEVVYHLLGGSLALRVHPHVERSIRLKTESTRRIIQLQAAHSNVGQDAVCNLGTEPLPDFSKRALHQRDLGPIGIWRDASATNQPFARDCERCRIFIEANQMSRCAEAFCDFVTVPAQTHRSVDIGPTPPHG